MTKAPYPGAVKTRLVPPLTPEQAAKLNACFLRDIGASIAVCCHKLRSSQNGSARGVGIYTPPGSEALYRNLLPRDFLLIPQRGENFRDRLLFAAEDLFAAGFISVCLINSDSPTVPPSSFEEAVTSLNKRDDRIVVGPADDGGYYLIGMKQLRRRLFDEIDWSTERVFKQTTQRAKEIGLKIHTLPPGYDVDDRIGLQRLRHDLFGPHAGMDVAPHTREFLGSL